MKCPKFHPSEVIFFFLTIEILILQNNKAHENLKTLTPPPELEN